MLRYLIGGSMLILTACSGLSPEACLATDWNALGYEDGTAGRNSFSRYHADCADHGITANFPAYQAGNAAGVALFCRPANGYRIGIKGQAYNGICPASLEPGFLHAHADGYGLYALRDALHQIAGELADSEHRAGEIEDLIIEITGRLASPGLPMDQRTTLAADLVALAHERGEIEITIHDLQQAHADAEVDLTDYQHRTAPQYGS